MRWFFSRRGAILAFLAALSACWWLAIRPEDDPRSPVVLTLWHNPGGQMKHVMSDVVDEFNRTVGREKGIVLVVTSIGKFEVLHEKVELIANGDPGAPQPPDIAIIYPKSATLLAKKNMLADIGAHFTDRELAAYVPRFLEEGRIDGRLYVFPIEKSTEGLLVNRTLFDRFSAATGTKPEQLQTVEGIVAAAQAYWDWTDSLTPDVPGDGKMFFMIDNPFNFAQVAFRQLGEEFLSDRGMNLSSPVFRKVWEAYYAPVVKGQEALYDGYGTDLTKTGDIVCWTSSTAGITFLPSAMTYADNSSEPVEFDLLPYPVYEGGKKVAIQRAGGFCLLKSNPLRENAAIVFLRWLTEPERNLRFLESTGYLPVTREAMKKAVESARSDMPRIHRRFLEIVSLMQREYDFLIPPPLDDFGALETDFEARLQKSAASSRERYEKLRETVEADVAFRAASEGEYSKFVGK